MPLKYKIRDVAFELDAPRESAKVYDGDHIVCFANAVEGWNYFVITALRPMEQALRAELEKHGYNRYTGWKEEDHEKMENNGSV
ncbi:MAG: hypothetical protein IJ071_10620 [Ruminococcus sp.]|nr:hypothetical protein [Ruminococcus sp.]